MKKFLALSLIAVMTAGVLAGCSSKTEEKPAEDKTEETTDGEATADGETYIVATDTVFPPFEFTDANGDFVGIDVDIINAIAEDQGISIDLQSLGFDAALLAVQSGQADGIIAGCSITDERKETFDFSEPYYTADVTVAVAADSDIKSFEDLAGKTVAVKTVAAAPVAYAHAPVSYAHAPVAYAHAPVVKTVAPVSAVTYSHAPVVKTVAPVAAVTYAHAPVVKTVAPVAHYTAPVIKTVAPAYTTYSAPATYVAHH